jgi:hypothetical protein
MARKPWRTTAATLDTDVMATGYCALLLVHDARLDALGEPEAAPPVRWRELSRSVKTAVNALPDPAQTQTARVTKTIPSLLQLDLARNDVPRTAVGLNVSDALRSTGLPAFIRISPTGGQRPEMMMKTRGKPWRPIPPTASNDEPAAASFSVVGVPARRMRSNPALLQWALAHARGCVSLAEADGGANPGASNASRWATTFLEDVVPGLGESVAHERHRVERLRTVAEAQRIAVEHEQLRGQRVGLLSMAMSRCDDDDAKEERELRGRDVCAPSEWSDLMRSHEWSIENDEALRSLLARVTEGAAGQGEREGLVSSEAIHDLEATGKAGGREELLSEAQARLMAARALDTQLQFKVSATTSRREQLRLLREMQGQQLAEATAAELSGLLKQEQSEQPALPQTLESSPPA